MKKIYNGLSTKGLSIDGFCRFIWKEVLAWVPETVVSTIWVLS